ncbi:MAG: discoidin domain-containing protein, partial [Planctomycetes bacterium]|nr:discoidin domain-containing protein [Planctomycetota bacterium]
MRVDRVACLVLCVSLFVSSPRVASAQVLDKQKLLEAQSFWDNRDWDWYRQQIPFFECPDEDINTTYYYRWELLTKHLTYGAPNTGYTFTEFIDRPFWSGAYGAISCPAGHQLYEARWLRQPEIARDYARYWFRTPGAQPRNYSTWLADAVWNLDHVHPDRAFLVNLLPDLVKNYEGWEQRHFVPSVGLFWQTGHDDGMEFNINSRQTKDILRGAPSYRPSFNAYMWADALAIAQIADLARDQALADRYRGKAAALKERVQTLLWDPQRSFFFPMYRDDEERDGHKIRARTLTYQSGQFAGDSHGRELIGYVPWQFNMLDSDRGYEAAWKKLMDRDGFYADFGPTTVERNDPMFLLQKSCCWWSGQSWPYATTQTLKALANLLQRGETTVVSPADYLRLLQIFARSHRKQGRPYLAEALHPDTGSFEGHDGYNHSEHYFHSGFCDLVITGLVGVNPASGSVLEIRPLAPDSWDWFALDDLPYQGRRLSILWDRDGSRYGKGAGLTVLVDGEKAASTPKLNRLEVRLPVRSASPTGSDTTARVNFAVNNDGTYFPRVTASHSHGTTPVSKVHDGNYWYLQHPPNRWTCADSSQDRDWLVLDFGTLRQLDQVKLYLLDDAGEQGSPIRTPRQVDLESWQQEGWHPVTTLKLAADPLHPQPGEMAGHRATTVMTPGLKTTKLRVLLHHQPGARSGLTEIEAWGQARLPVEPVAPPAGNLAYNPRREGFPKATASFSDRFGGQPGSAIDGKTVFLPTPMNRWTSYESKSASDWLEIDFGKDVEYRRVELAIYDDRGGVQPPTAYTVQFWTGSEWREVDHLNKSPAEPVGGEWNTARFDPVKSSRVRLVFSHRGQARSGVT